MLPLERAPLAPFLVIGGEKRVRLIGITGWSGAGKTTLLAKLIPELRARGLKVSTLKHAHHAFDVDQPGKDSHVHRVSGATETLIASAKRFALMRELRDEAEWTLPQLLTKLTPVDLVLVEGFKRETHPKIEIFRQANGRPALHPEDPHIRAIATDHAFPLSSLPQAALDDIRTIADLVAELAIPVAHYLSSK